MKQRWLKRNLGQKVLCLLQAALILVFSFVYAVMKVDSPALAFGILLCVINAGSILFVDELFRRKIRKRVENPQSAIPSPMERLSRWISWSLCTLLSVALFAMGLTGI